ncbi:Putative uncharacterized protein [Lacticaseibacillus paracasei]|nr:Putative uncharacterized protein [Lacticaseibacillus paracasei]
MRDKFVDSTAISAELLFVFSGHVIRDAFVVM